MVMVTPGAPPDVGGGDDIEVFGMMALTAVAAALVAGAPDADGGAGRSWMLVVFDMAPFGVRILYA
jgi:hypothetical protein